jgi:hypothetical protein
MLTAISVLASGMIVAAPAIFLISSRAAAPAGPAKRAAASAPRAAPECLRAPTIWRSGILALAIDFALPSRRPPGGSRRRGRHARRGRARLQPLFARRLTARRLRFQSRRRACSLARAHGRR